jgi:hypothetical protein
MVVFIAGLRVKTPKEIGSEICMWNPKHNEMTHLFSFATVDKR